MAHGIHQAESNVKEIVIFHSNDIHSNLEQAAKIASMIQLGRKQYGKECVIAVDVGDHMDRSRMETEGTDGLVHQAILNETAYDVITLGNNEGLTFTAAQLDHIYQHRTYDVICCNIERNDGVKPSWLRSSTIIERCGLKVGFIAATANFAQFYDLMGWTTVDPLPVIKKEVEQLSPQCDVVVFMSHLGIRYDERIADECEGIDIILGAHTHHLFNPPQRRNGKLMCAAEKFGSYLGKVVLKYDVKTREVNATGEVIPTAAYAEHAGVMSIIAQGKKDAQATLCREITVLEEPLEASDVQETPLPNLLAIGLRHWCNGDIGIVNSGQLLGGLAIGPVSAGELHGICPSPINPCLMILKGSELLEALQQSLLPQYQNMKLKGFGFRGEQLGVLAVDGLEIHYSLENASIHHVLVHGEPLNLEKSYRVASIDMFTFNVGYQSLSRSSEVEFYLPQFIRSVLEKELQNSEHIAAAKYKRWIKH